MSDNNSDEFVVAIVNLVKRLNRIERRLTIIETTLRFTKLHVNNNARSKWEKWSRKVILKIIEFFIVVVSAIVGVKLAGG